MEERELKKSNKSLLIMFIIFLIILGCVVVYFKLFGNNDDGGECPSDKKSNNDSVKAEDGISWYDLNAIFYIEELDNTLGKENKTGFLKYKDSYVVNPDGDKVNPLMMLIGEKDGEAYGEMYIFDNDRNVYTINLDDIVNGKEKIETSKYNSKDIIDLSITTKYSVPTVKDLKDYYFDNYQVKVIYSDNKEEMFEGKNILSGTVLDFD